MAEGLDHKNQDHREESAPHRSKKDRKRWCKGKVGVEHNPEIRIPDNRSGWQNGASCRGVQWSRYHWFCYHAWVCQNCQKRLGSVSKEECPDYKA